MDFYHVLPSNTSPTYYPKNNASDYSTPLDKPYEFHGDWEMALMSLTYSTCVKTFNDDIIIIQEKCTVAECARQEKSPLKVFVELAPPDTSAAQARQHFMSYINKNFKSLLHIEMSKDEKFCTWKLSDENFYYILSPGLQTMFQFWSDVLSDADESYKNFNAFYKPFVPRKQNDVWIIVAPKKKSVHEIHAKFEIKKKKEKLTAQQLLDRLRKYIAPGVVKFSMIPQKNQFEMRKLYNDKCLVMLNAPLRKALTFKRAGMYHPGEQQYLSCDLNNEEDEWTVEVICLKDIEQYSTISTRVVKLSPCSFQEEQEAISYVNKKVNDNRISFTCGALKQITLKITSAEMTVIFSNTLRDIFAFDKNIYSGPLSYTSTGAFSLTRCIQYLYIYSNLGSNIRIGNTEAPLLAIIPFSNDKGCSLLTEKIFKTPMYIHVKQSRVSQIDVAIYDGAGDIVPFVDDAVTTLCLHFRQV